MYFTLDYECNGIDNIDEIISDDDNNSTPVYDGSDCTTLIGHVVCIHFTTGEYNNELLKVVDLDHPIIQIGVLIANYSIELEELLNNKVIFPKGKYNKETKTLYDVECFYLINRRTIQ